MGGGVTNRYKGRLAPVNEFLSSHLGPLDPCSAKLLKMAGVEFNGETAAKGPLNIPTLHSFVVKIYFFSGQRKCHSATSMFL